MGYSFEQLEFIYSHYVDIALGVIPKDKQSEFVKRTGTSSVTAILGEWKADADAGLCSLAPKTDQWALICLLQPDFWPAMLNRLSPMQRQIVEPYILGYSKPTVFDMQVVERIKGFLNKKYIRKDYR